MNTNSDTRKGSELENRTSRSDEDSVKSWTGAPSEVKREDMWNISPSAPNIEAGATDSGPPLPSVKDSCAEYGDDDIEIEADYNEIGVLYCCGSRLIWHTENIEDIMETSCEKCGTKYAMSLNNDEEPEEGWRDWTDWRDVA